MKARKFQDIEIIPQKQPALKAGQVWISEQGGLVLIVQVYSMKTTTDKIIGSAAIRGEDGSRSLFTA